MATIDEVIARLRAIGHSPPGDDGVRVFTRVYERVTVALRDRLGTGFFEDDHFVEQFDIIFAGRYFAAVDAAAAGLPVGHAWQPLFSRRTDQRIHPLQFVLAGMNAHINFDLPLAVVAACVAERTEPDAGTVVADYQKVNVVLASVESEVRNSLLDDLVRHIGRPLEPLQHLVGSWSIGNAREAAWVRAQLYWHLRGIPLLLDPVVAVSDSAVGMTGEQLLTPLLDLVG